MKIVKKGQAGTMQSSDLMVTVEPADELVIEIQSTVKKQFEHLMIGHILYPVFQKAFLYSFCVILMHDYRLFSSHEQMFILLILAHL